MKKVHPVCLYFALFSCLLATPSLSRGVTFTTAAQIAGGNTNYEGADIIVTNCILTVDGPHTFASLTLQNGGVLTHTYGPNGYASQSSAVSGESHALSYTNLELLACANLADTNSIVVQDLYSSITYTNGADYLILPQSDGTVGLLLPSGSLISEGSTNLVSYTCGITVASGLNLTITGDALVQAGGAILADFKGYAGSAGSGRGNSSGYPASGSGATYGGNGGQSASGAQPATGYLSDLLHPANKGAGGGSGFSGSGGSGGGLIQLAVNGLLLNDGLISANGSPGTNARSGGGSGGGIWLSCAALLGSGQIQANGGNGEPTAGGGGGGGRIGISYGTNLYTGAISAFGGQGYACGGAGTIYQRTDSGAAASLLLDNSGRSGATAVLTSIPSADLTVRNGAIMNAFYTKSSGVDLYFANLLLSSNGWININASLFSISGNATIDAGCGISADGTGSSGGTGSGAGHSVAGGYSYYGTGASHGGMGGKNSSYYGPYDSLTVPVQAGSGGGAYYNYYSGGSGGGILHLVVGGTLLLNGTLSANGTAGLSESAGGGSGGSLWIVPSVLAGSGKILANGGDGDGSGIYAGGGGGGGRIAVYPSTDLFFGAYSARGGAGQQAGGAGTIFVQGRSQSYGSLVVDNGGQTGGAGTAWSSSSTMDLTLRNGAVAYLPNQSSLNNLVLNGNAWILTSNLTFTVNGSAFIGSGCGILADGTIFTGSTGRGSYDTYSAGGGAYGGRGGHSLSNSAGGTPYGDGLAPTTYGSPGGCYSANAGGAGGGYLRLTVGGTLAVDGTLSANGSDSPIANAGAGSGGGIYLAPGTLTGTGAITANGGNGYTANGGGGGGRIAIISTANQFTGRISAAGGNGAQPGGAGTIYTKLTGQSIGQLLINNHGLAGADTPLNSLSSVGLTLLNGAVASSYSSANLDTLWIGSNAWWISSNSTITVSGNASILAGGGLSADGQSSYQSSAWSGNYAYVYIPYGTYVGGGGAYGGNGGGAALAPGIGGAAFYQTSPIGGTCGGGTSLGNGGRGGGVANLTVTGTLLLDGSLSSKGKSPTNSNFGAGSGGHVALNVGTLSGTGVITADGGSVAGNGGGGGGGRIIIAYTSANGFGGALSAKGGLGYYNGGAGTITVQKSSAQTSQTIVDAAGQPGAGTPWLGVSSGDWIIRNGAVLRLTGSQSIASLQLTSNSWILCSNLSSAASLTVSGNAIISAGSGIASVAFGSYGSGAGASVISNNISYGGGGGYGGYGGSAINGAGGGSPFGAANSPYYSGAGKGGGAGGGMGGGWLKLTFNSSLLLDGTLSADGAPASLDSGGGGAGGGLSVSATSLSGSGLISANGGAGGAMGGGGGGGRVYLTCATSTFGGQLQTFGGAGFQPGGAGTIYSRGGADAYGKIVIDNGGQNGASTTLGSTTALDLIVRNGGILTGSSWLYFNTLYVGSNGWLAGQSIIATIYDSATIASGGGILANGTGYTNATSTSSGSRAYSSTYGYLGGGGSGGGLGSSAIFSNSLAPGGAVVSGSLSMPSSFGGCGGGGSDTTYGGAGGGYIHLNVAKNLILNGAVSANGLMAVRPGCGGGAGGSIDLTASTFSGVGLISANGGAGNSVGGGGGGGRIAIKSPKNTFAGQATAYGGASPSGYGGAGTLYTGAGTSGGLVTVNNGGIPGTNTPIASLPGTSSLSVVGGGRVFFYYPALTLGNLVIGSNSVLAGSGTPTCLNLTLYGNLTLASGGWLTLDEAGFASGLGNGAGAQLLGAGSGGGYGGVGGNSLTTLGGATYGSIQSPQDPGSGGGQGLSAGSGGAGGGALYLTVGGIAQLDGYLSANGGNASFDGAGGGSGGSLWLAAPYVIGSGFIAANGGSGDPALGGGGGGGRIAIASPHNFFNGFVSAAGGDGFSRGQDGTFFKTSALPEFYATDSSPAGTFTNAVDTVYVSFNQIYRIQTAALADFTLNSPTGAVASDSISFQQVSANTLGISFPAQTAEGTYTYSFGPNLQSLLGVPMSQPITNTFSIVWPTISGTVIDTSNQPVAAVLIQPSDSLGSAVTDTNGQFQLKVVPSGDVTLTPSIAGSLVVPSVRYYWEVTSNIDNQIFVLTSSARPSLTSVCQGNNFRLSYFGISGLTYQLSSSTNLIDWDNETTMQGTNGPIDYTWTIDEEPQRFFRLQTQY
jgi:hypothetical protein